jgi:hypothetical protein
MPPGPLAVGQQQGVEPEGGQDRGEVLVGQVEVVHVVHETIIKKIADPPMTRSAQAQQRQEIDGNSMGQRSENQSM